MIHTYDHNSIFILIFTAFTQKEIVRLCETHFLRCWGFAFVRTRREFNYPILKRYRKLNIVYFNYSTTYKQL